ncbi:Uu.00g070310.m01.CDS01 [Anthostomella pinea]|uniref:Uu.00g070310.m01.CDS01 n=1 Tax=Anthostomella pinea TaxID=933095 RepID=A0AAI8YNS2_9PEZI|nr:Uu.00g070310.m01.CDS01 [Anthostomella pinea]
METWDPVYATAALLLPLAAAKCKKFDFTGEYGADGATAPYNGSFPVSSFVNCTESLASSDGGNADGCSFERYAMGLVVHPDVIFVDADAETRKNIFSLVREGATGALAASTNFNSTIVMNYTATNTEAPLGKAGHYSFTPFLACWDGVLSDCGDGDAIENKTVEACGLVWKDDKQSALRLGQQLYDGDERFAEDSEASDGKPQKAYDEVAGQATVETLDSEGGAASHIPSVGSFALTATLMWFGYLGIW